MEPVLCVCVSVLCVCLCDLKGIAFSDSVITVDIFQTGVTSICKVTKVVHGN